MNKWSKLVAEAGAVTVGVLLAFVIQAWWEEQQEAEDKERLLRVVIAELEQVEVYLAGNIEELDHYQQRLAKGLSMFGLQTDMSETEIATEAAKIGMWVPNPAPRSAFDDLVSSGSFRLIENPDIRYKINLYRQKLEQATGTYAFLRSIDSKFVDYSLKYANLYSMPGFEWQHPAVDVNNLDIAPDRSRLLGNREMANLIWLRLSWVGIYRSILVTQAKIANELRVAIEKEVE